ncbi:MAG: CoA transferase [Microscillaceae bacterium]|nr:CoA transferase [Microscillaceae bacterium]
MPITIQDIFQHLAQRFKADKSADFQGVFHFIFSSDEPTPVEYTVKINSGICEVLPGLQGIPQCTVKTEASTYLDIELGKLDAQTALLGGRLQIDHLGEMLRFSQLFRKYSPPLSSQKPITASPSRKPQSGPLLGLKILDFTRLLPGPLATMMLGDMGAEVIKIEAPDFYDYTRDMPPHKEGESLSYLAFGRSKRSLCLDYQSEEGRSIILDLVQQSDILLEQFRPGVMQKMGLDYETLKAIHPALIYVSITGYGQTGPYAHLAGHDLNYITLAGILSGNSGQTPQIPLIQIADIAGGSYMAVTACLSALYARSQSGLGQWVDVSMMDGAMPLAVNTLSLFWANYQNIRREEFLLSGGMLNYNIYPTQDGRFVALGTLEPKFWERFCEAVGKPDWKNRMYTQNPQELQTYKAELSALFQTQTGAYWHEWGIQNDLLLNLVYEQGDIEHDPQVKARQMVIEQEHPKAGKIKNLGVPLKFSGTPAQAQWVAPMLGEDSVAILQEMGISEQKIQELVDRGILKIPG